MNHHDAPCNISPREVKVIHDIFFLDNRIASIERLDTHQPMPILEIEPEEIMLFFGRERKRRRLVSIRRIPVYLTYAILAAEDSRFYLHHGVDPRGMLRALYTNIRHGEVRQGWFNADATACKKLFPDAGTDITPEI